ncbi:MAG TPA: HNH endonuclease [Polyangiaceae bacterium]|jgi:hypothetical protein|nr:HNH endonuclease [Polyangiaceae bacterium]
MRDGSETKGAGSQGDQTPENQPEWVHAHEQLSRLAKARAALDAEEGRWLLCALRSAAHLHLGFGSFSEYVEVLFGYKPRSTEEKLRVAEALEELPELERALGEGSLSWSVVRELTRVATPETQAEWIATARGRTARQVEQLVAGRGPGDRPSTPARAGSRRHVLRFEVEAETLATFREAMAKLRCATDGALDDDSMLLLMARQVLGGPPDEGRANYQVALTVCEECGRGFQQGRGELIEVDPEIVEMASCDAQHIGQTRPRPPDSEPAHVGAHSDSEHPARAKQRIAPAVRRHVLRRDGGRCVVPGCKNAVFLDIHHVELSSDGGASEETNLVTLCGAHHRAQHRGALVLEGSVPTGLVFRHADGSPYGRPASAPLADAHGKVFLALRKLGFREAEAKEALSRVRSRNEAQNPEQVLREALSLLTPSSVASRGATARPSSRCETIRGPSTCGAS